MQPHDPFVGSDIPQERRMNGRYWDAYDENLEYVLEEVWRLLDALPGKSVVTGGHGQISPGALRDRLGVGGHEPRLRHPGLVVVPWAVVNGERRNVVRCATDKANSDGVDERLRDLGYKV